MPAQGMVDHEFYPDLAAKTAVLMYTLAKSQACPDGNKRIALLLTDAFVRLNDHELPADSDLIADKILELAESDAADRDNVLKEATEWARQYLTPL